MYVFMNLARMNESMNFVYERLYKNLWIWQSLVFYESMVKIECCCGNEYENLQI